MKVIILFSLFTYYFLGSEVYYSPRGPIAMDKVRKLKKQLLAMVHGATFLPLMNTQDYPDLESVSNKCLECNMDELETKEEFREQLERRGITPTEDSYSALYRQLWTIMDKENKKRRKYCKFQSSKQYIKLDKNEREILYGTKMANVLQFMDELWQKEPEARIIMFSRVQRNLSGCFFQYKIKPQ